MWGRDMGKKSVEIIHDQSGWTVEVIECGDTFARAFAIETFAISYADGQRKRLKLEPPEASPQEALA
jgi:hypothetical protein